MSQTKAQLLGPLVADNIDIEGDLNFDSGTLKVDPTNDRVGINKGANAPEKTLDVGGDVQLADLYLTADYPTIRPTLDLAFAQTKQLDSRITFTRSSTATYVDENGIIQTAAVNTPRFDHDPVTGESLGLLVEEARTNIQQFSYNNFNQIGTAGNAETIDNQYIAPDGTQTAAAFFEATTTQQHYIQLKPVSVTSGVEYVFSFFAKNINRTSDVIAITSGGGFPYTVVRFYTNDVNNNEVVTGSSTTRKTKYPNGWYRFSCTMTANATQLSYPYIDFRMLNSAAGSADRMAIWGFQTEAGSFPTSYIPTSGSAVTRSSDIATITGTNFSSWYNQSESTFYVESSSSPASAAKKFFTLDDITTNGSLSELVELATQQTDKVNIFTYNNSTQSDIRVTPAGTGRFKAAATFKVNDVQISVDGTLGTADTTASHPSQIDRMTIGNYISGNYYVNCPISRITYYPRRLNNSQLQNITL